MSTFVKGEKIKYPTITEDILEFIEDENSPYVYKLSKSKFDLTKCIGCPYLYFIDMLLPTTFADEDVFQGNIIQSMFEGTIWISANTQVNIETIDEEYYGITINYSMLQSPFGNEAENDNSINDKIGLIESVKEQPESKVSEQAKTNFKTNMGSFADWNAQVGEAGYINNRPCYVNLDNGHRITLDNADITLSSDENRYEKIIIPIDEFKISLYYYNLYEGFIHYVLTEGQSVFDYHFGCKFTAVLNEYDRCDLLLTDFGDSKEYVDNTFAKIKIVYDYNDTVIGKLNSVYLPYTVLQTTPQTLSDTDKNQALANLGIDPVVWKYMCNPYCIDITNVINHYTEKSDPIPSDLQNVLHNVNSLLIPKVIVLTNNDFNLQIINQRDNEIVVLDYNKNSLLFFTINDDWTISETGYN